MKTLCLLIVLALTAGCATRAALRKPGPVDRSVLTQGQDRLMVIGVLGKPVFTDSKSAQTLSDVYRYEDGGVDNSGGAKAARIVLYTMTDVASLWIMEIFWTPLEHAFTVDTYAATVDYAKRPDQHWAVVKADEREVK